MVNFVFFLSVFSSFSWLIFCWTYISDKLHGMSFSSLGVVDVLVFTTIITIPVLIMWTIFGHIISYLNSRNLNKKVKILLEQSKRSQEYSDLIARVLIENEQSARADTIINKFDFFISELNEITAEILRQLGITDQRIIDSQAKIKNGEKWSMGNLLLDINNQNSKFSRDLLHRTKVDGDLASALVLFCNNYQRIVAILEKHDKDRFFYNTLEGGVFGKIFYIFTPVYETIKAKEEPELIVETRIEPKLESQKTKKNEQDEPIQIALTSEIKEEKSSWLSGFFDKKKDQEIASEKVSPMIDKDSFYMFIENGKSKKDESIRKEPMLSENADESDRTNR